MDLSSGSWKGKGKRTADDADIANAPQNMFSFAVPRNPTHPQVVRRHIHRRYIIANLHPIPTARSVPPPRPVFNVYKAILRHPNLFFQFAMRLEPQQMDDLLAIDKEFHFRFNCYSASIIHDYACHHAKEAAYVFTPHVYLELTISDPLLRPMDGRPHLARDVPSMRWTKMVFYRDAVVREILTLLALEGHGVPRGVSRVVMLFWLIMGKNTTERRAAFLRDRKTWSDESLLLFHLFLVKLDMRFTSPVLGHGICGLSHLLLNQKTLTMLADVMADRTVFSYDDCTDLMIRTYLQEDLDTITFTWMDNDFDNGVPEEHWGLMSREDWGMWQPGMKSALDMLVLETVRRGLNAQKYLLDYVCYGSVDEEKGTNVIAPRRWRGEGEVMFPTEAWPCEDVRIGMISRLDSIWQVGLGEQGETAGDDTERVDGETATVPDVVKSG